MAKSRLERPFCRSCCRASGIRPRAIQAARLEPTSSSCGRRVGYCRRVSNRRLHSRPNSPPCVSCRFGYDNSRPSIELHTRTWHEWRVRWATEAAIGNVRSVFGGESRPGYGWYLDGETFGAGTIRVSLYESCSWPPAPGADVTGYSRILVSSVNGETKWGGEFDPLTEANVLDTSCKNMVITYIGGHTGASFSQTVTVSAGQLVIAGQQRTYQGEPSTVSSWAQSVNYYITPGETVVLHEPPLVAS